MFHLAYKIVENEKDAGYLCIEEQTYKVIAWSKADVMKLVQNKLIFGCAVKNGKIVNSKGYSGLGEVNNRKIDMATVKQFIRYKNGLCKVKINGIAVKNSEVRIAVEFKFTGCSKNHGAAITINRISNDIKNTGGKVITSENGGKYILVNCNTAQLTMIINSDACAVSYSEPNMIMKSTAPSEWKKKCCEWFRMYAMAIDGVAPEVKRNPYAKVVSSTILSEKFPNCRDNMQLVVKELCKSGMVRVAAVK